MGLGAQHRPHMLRWAPVVLSFVIPGAMPRVPLTSEVGDPIVELHPPRKEDGVEMSDLKNIYCS